MTQVRFKLAWQRYRVGDVISPPGVLRDWLIQHGYCERIVPEQPAAPAVVECVPEPAPASTGRRRKSNDSRA